VLATTFNHEGDHPVFPLIYLFTTYSALVGDGLGDSSLRFATFNCSLAAQSKGELAERLSSGKDAQAISIAQIIRIVRPDVLLLNEFDFDAEGRAAKLFREHYLQREDLSDAEPSTEPIEYPFCVSLPSNTGMPTGFDMDNDGVAAVDSGTPEYARDAKGYGTFEGQYGMLLLSRRPIDHARVRTFQRFLWKDMPNAQLPDKPKTREAWYSDEELAVLPLSSKSHWDVPIVVGEGSIHVLASHPTPPVFDGPEDRNGHRNHDEIRLFVDYVQPDHSAYIYDDKGERGGLPKGTRFVVMGDLNSDPVDGDGHRAVDQWLLSSLVVPAEPHSMGGVEASRSGTANASHSASPAADTSDFDDERGPGNLRLDYVLPSRGLSVAKSAVFWPGRDDPISHQALISASDHRLVWVDLVITDAD
jgi:endonuclease/exonuclease/phosphatase family metal-dependent hydrolase